MCDYLLLAIAKKVYHIEQNLYIFSQAVGLVLFERIPLSELFKQIDNSKLEPENDGQLRFWYFIPDTNDIRYFITKPGDNIDLVAPMFCDTLLTLKKSEGTKIQDFNGILDFAVSHSNNPFRSASADAPALSSWHARLSLPASPTLRLSDAYRFLFR